LKIAGVICAAMLLAPGAAAQKPAKKNAPASKAASRNTAERKVEEPRPAAAEDDALEEALREAGSSAIEYSRALERHLRLFPNSERKSEILRVLAQSALEQKDSKRLLLYGVPVLDDGGNNIALMDYVCRALLERGTEADAAKALGIARRMAEVTAEQRKEWLADKTARVGRARRMEEFDAAMGRAYWHEARALRIAGEREAALQAIEKSWAEAPLEETARERSRLLEMMGRKADAAAAFADAITTGGLDLRDAADRERLQMLAGDRAGAVLLEAWSRSEARHKQREARFLSVDPNYGARRISDFTLSAVQGEPLALKTLLGKVVVIDFWATWCGPCRAQHPLYEVVKKRFADRPEVVFLSVSTDENREAVPPFLEAMGWSKATYYDDGLASNQRVSSIPTTMILDRDGSVASRLHGFAADRFVDMLTARIKLALGEGE
jgi:thiol-disulfide isomerase/thioredoxin